MVGFTNKNLQKYLEQKPQGRTKYTTARKLFN